MGMARRCADSMQRTPFGHSETKGLWWWVFVQARARAGDAPPSFMATGQGRRLVGGRRVTSEALSCAADDRGGI